MECGRRWQSPLAYSSIRCRQYIENIAAARAAGPHPPAIDKLPPFWSHHDSSANGARRRRCADSRPAPEHARLVYTAHSIPLSMTPPAAMRTARPRRAPVSERAGHEEWALVWQSRKRPPTQPWLEPDILDTCARSPKTACATWWSRPRFLSDHMEVMYDLDYEAARLCAIWINFVRPKNRRHAPLRDRHAGRAD